MTIPAMLELNVRMNTEGGCLQSFLFCLFGRRIFVCYVWHGLPSLNKLLQSVEAAIEFLGNLHNISTPLYVEVTLDIYRNAFLLPKRTAMAFFSAQPLLAFVFGMFNHPLDAAFARFLGFWFRSSDRVWKSDFGHCRIRSWWHPAMLAMKHTKE
jgi:hypothetical protein